MLLAKMNMIEVDAKLFVKCRLCLDETGQYQIVPNVQMQIKYCFDIDVEPFDGLPQLVCKKCESILSQYAGIKQIFQEKQKNLKSKLISNANVENIIQQQQDTVSSTQADTDNKNKIEEITRINRISPVPTRHPSSESETSIHIQRKKKKTTQIKRSTKAWESKYTKFYVCRYCDKSYKNVKSIYTHIKRQCKLYKKYSYINKTLCSVRLNKIGAQSNITGSNDKVVCDQNRVIQSSKINYYVLYSKSLNNEQNLSESSDEDFFFEKKKRKRQRLISRSSNETVVIEQNTAKSSNDEKVARDDKKSDTQTDAYIECVNLDDSDSNSTKSSARNTKDSETIAPGRISTINDKMVNNIIAMCLTKYMTRLNASVEGNPAKAKEESSLKHKILSIGRKVVCNTGTNTTGLLRYMEYKNLEVDWVSKMDSKVIIRTKSKESENNYHNKNMGWENVTSIPIHNHKTQDFALDFEINSELENLNLDITQSPGNTTEKEKAASGIIYVGNLKEIEKPSKTTSQQVGKSLNCDLALDNVSNQVNNIDTKSTENIYFHTVLDADKNWKKLLNANPVANPKQLPKKYSSNEPASLVKIYTNELQNDSEIAEQSSTKTNNDNDMLNMPIITSTVSLAPVDKEQANVDCSNQNTQNGLNKDSINSKPQSNMPKIKVKPASELMSEKALSQHNNAFVSTSGWTLDTESQKQNMLQAKTNNMIYIASGGPFTNVVPVQQNVLYYPQIQDVESVSNTPIANNLGSKKLPYKKEFVKLHTIELPNSRTDSPFRYFQKLLQVHNIHLYDGEECQLLSKMNCLMKFKVVFEQESNSPVKLCLLLFCDGNVFCMQVADEHMKHLDITQFSAHWQWEILKVFKGDDIVPKLLTNAMKISTPTLNYTTYFTNLLKSIIFTKES